MIQHTLIRALQPHRETAMVTTMLVDSILLRNTCNYDWSANKSKKKKCSNSWCALTYCLALVFKGGPQPRSWCWLGVCGLEKFGNLLVWWTKPRATVWTETVRGHQSNSGGKTSSKQSQTSLWSESLKMRKHRPFIWGFLWTMQVKRSQKSIRGSEDAFVQGCKKNSAGNARRRLVKIWSALH